MLKWAVNQPRPSYLEGKAIDYNDFHAAAPIPNPIPATTPSPFPTPLPTPAVELIQQRSKMKKRSSLVPALNLGKENQLTSTPLPTSSSTRPPRTPLLRDLSNIMTPATPATPMPTPTPTATPPLHPGWSQSKPTATTAYASTLPTFEAEFSPSYGPTGTNNIIPGPLLALRGMGIPDSYFEKPRYLEQKSLLPAKSVDASAPSASCAPDLLEQTTLSSTKMGDVTLERMIDAILESTRKVPAPTRPGAAPSLRTRQHQHQNQRLRQRQHHLRHREDQKERIVSTSRTVVHSPTYRQAFDPASDLCEYWHPGGYEEREVRSPQPHCALGSVSGSLSGPECEVVGKGGKRRSMQLQLRRQRVVRRKRKIATKISSSVRQSAQKLLAAASRSAQKLPQSRSRHISPDSGHNSTSDCDFEGEEIGPCGGCLVEAATKRRLSFSFHEDTFVKK